MTKTMSVIVSVGLGHVISARHDVDECLEMPSSGIDVTRTPHC